MASLSFGIRDPAWEFFLFAFGVAVLSFVGLAYIGWWRQSYDEWHPDEPDTETSRFEPDNHFLGIARHGQDLPQGGLKTTALNAAGCGEMTRAPIEALAGVLDRPMGLVVSEISGFWVDLRLKLPDGLIH